MSFANSVVYVIVYVMSRSRKMNNEKPALVLEVRTRLPSPSFPPGGCVTVVTYIVKS